MIKMSSISDQMVDYISANELTNLNVDMRILEYSGKMAAVISKLSTATIGDIADDSAPTYATMLISDETRIKLFESVDKLLTYVNLLNFSREASIDFDIDPEDGFGLDDVTLVGDHVTHNLVRVIIGLNTAASDLVYANNVPVDDPSEDGQEKTNALHQLIVQVYTLSAVLIHMLGSNMKLEMDKEVSLLRMEYAIHARTFDKE